ncbi:MAG: hypothetical protein K8T20_15605 [Planctomycetes bacterium]|nr:hypothetical protein [Planctomycetota bacterium]
MPRMLKSMLLLALLPLAAFSDPEKPSVRAIVYQVWVVESGLEMIHGGGRWIREVHLADANISFNVEDDRLNCFVPEEGRYAERKSGAGSAPAVETVDPHSPRRLGEIDVEPGFVSSLQRLLKQRDEAREVAKKVLEEAPPLEK